MGDMSEWGVWPAWAPPSYLSPDRRLYLQYLREAHDDEGFQLAACDEIVATDEEVERITYEAEMCANYHVV